MGVTDVLCCRCSDNRSLNDFSRDENTFQHLVNFYPTCAHSVQFRWLNVNLQCCLKRRAVLCSLLVTWGVGIRMFWNTAEEADVDSSVSRCMQYPNIPVFLRPGLLALPPPFGGLRGRTCPNILVYNPLILESRLWNLRDVLWFVCSSCEVTGQGVLDAKKGSPPKTAARSRWGQAGEQHKGQRGTRVLLLATPWSPHAAVCSNRLLTSDGLSVWGEVHTEYLMSYSEGGSSKTTSKEYDLNNNLKGKKGVRGLRGRQVSWLIAKMDFNTEEHCGYKKIQLLFDSVFWLTHHFSCFWLSGCSGLFPWSSSAHQICSILWHFQRDQLRPFPWTSSLETELSLCILVTCQIWCSCPMFGDLCAALFCGTGISPVSRRKVFYLTWISPGLEWYPRGNWNPCFFYFK